MPYTTNEEVRKSVKSTKKYSNAQVTAFRKAFNASLAACMKDGGTHDDCESKAFAAGHASAKKARLEAVESAHYGRIATITVGIYDKEDATYTGEDLWYYTCQENWKTYIYDGLACLAVYSGWSKLEFTYHTS